MKKFIGEAITPSSEAFDLAAMARGEPSLPPEFVWRERRLLVDALVDTRRSYHLDRGDRYLDRHWYVFTTAEGEVATVYFARRAKRGEPRWRLSTLETSE